MDVNRHHIPAVLPWERNLVATEQEAGEALKATWMIRQTEKSLARTRSQTPDCPTACSLVSLPTMLFWLPSLSKSEG